MTEQIKILIVDDDSTARIILKAQLEKLGYLIIEAQDGEQAVQQYESNHPDVIFMDVLMPVMDGYEATREIKKIVGEKYVPIVFLTALTEEDNLVRCLDEGGDDFLIKPISISLLKSKLKSIERARGIYFKVQEQNQILMHDEQIAEELFARMIEAENKELEKLGVIYKPASTFSGDLVLSTRSPTGELYVMLGDFTGHGLNAAIGALPVSQIFNAMAKKGYALSSIIAEINKKLCDMMPTGKFCAAAFISVSVDVSSLKIWNAGLPDVLIYSQNSRKIVNQFRSTGLALGILPEQSDLVKETYITSPGDYAILMTDGVIEAKDSANNMIGMEKTIEYINNWNGEISLVNEIEKMIDNYTHGLEQDDDISLVTIQCDETLVGERIIGVNPTKKSNIAPESRFEEKWQTHYDIYPATGIGVNPIPSIISQIQDFENVDERSAMLFTVLSELYNNALEHGLLELDSYIKTTHSGFENYYEEKSSRLEKLKSGTINIHIAAKSNETGKSILVINIIDSGKGFDISELYQMLKANTGYCGRGIPLVQEICDSVTYNDIGNSVEAVFVM